MNTSDKTNRESFYLGNLSTIDIRDSNHMSIAAISRCWNEWQNLSKSQYFLIKAGVIVGGGGFVFGYDIGMRID
jgi:hypothetical protein